MIVSLLGCVEGRVQTDSSIPVLQSETPLQIFVVDIHPDCPSWQLIEPCAQSRWNQRSIESSIIKSLVHILLFQGLIKKICMAREVVVQDYYERIANIPQNYSS